MKINPKYKIIFRCVHSFKVIIYVIKTTSIIAADPILKFSCNRNPYSLYKLLINIKRANIFIFF